MIRRRWRGGRPEGGDVALAGLGRALRLRDCSAMMATLRQAMPGWPLSVELAQGPAPPIRLRSEGNGYRQHAPALPRGLFLDSAVSAACSLTADLVSAFFARHPELIGLHAAAVELDGCLVLFPAEHRAGKSTLTAAFAAADQRVFSDDALALTPAGEGMALGVAPRLRLPLPTRLEPVLHAFITRHAGPEDAHYRYLALPDGQLAAHGERRGLGGLVLLERDEHLDVPELVSLAPGDGVWQLLCQHFAHAETRASLMPRFLALMEGLPCWLLRYADPMAAARLVADQLGAPVQASPPQASLSSVPRSLPRPMPLDSRWQAHPAIRDYPLDDELFLIDPESGAIHRLNVTGRAVWALLRVEALSSVELAAALQTHFAGAEASVVKADVQQLLAQLAHAGLIEAVSETGCQRVAVDRS
ncbi:PqqD family protein [Halomonas sp. NO4]|uniref:PqqD family peptide modification chaperone n=1 Tax=Halomonas sp. NO4 TaxID=2484813 RepID=UPI001F08E680|nr:PqqD family protein [Halomonas sp. NO4]